MVHHIEDKLITCNIMVKEFLKIKIKQTMDYFDKESSYTVRLFFPMEQHMKVPYKTKKRMVKES